MVIKILKRSFSAIFGLLCIGLILVTAIEVLSFRVKYDTGGVFLGFFSIILLSLLASSLLSSSFEEITWKQYSMKTGLILIFVFYCLILFHLHFTSRHTFINTNIYKNVIAFAPMGFFLPLLFQKLRKFLPFICAVILMIAVIELAQFIMDFGILNIKDFIFNLSSTALAFFLCKSRFLKKLFHKLHWLN